MKVTNLKLVLRTLYRNKMYTLINILGLSIGMTCAILIFLWVHFQISYDRFHKNEDSICRVVQDQHYTNGEIYHVHVTPAGLSRIFKENIANIIHASRYIERPFLLYINGTKTMEEVHLVDSDFFQIFSFPLLKGKVKTVFANPHSMVLTEKMAAKYFGKKNPLGETVMLESKYPFIVTGVIKDCPENTEIKYDILIPFQFFRELGIDVNDLGDNWVITYVQLSPGTSIESMNQIIDDFKKKNFPKAEAKFYLQPLKSIHLYWLEGGGPIKNVRLFSLIALLIILIASINFTNLSTAMAGRRLKEIGVKKVFGANRNVLLRQFYSETLMLSFTALFIALILAESLLPWYNSLIKTQLKINYFDWKLICGALSIMFLTGILSGTYPALFLSSLRPVKILKGAPFLHGRSFLRETLVIFQFCLTIILIVNTIIIKKQRDYLQKKDVGVQKENIIYLPVRGELHSKFDLFKSELSDDPAIKSICFSSYLPTGIWSNSGSYKWQGKPDDVDPLVSHLSVDFDYARTYGIKMHEGSFFPEGNYIDTIHIVINKTFADLTGLDPILGQVIEHGGTKFQVIGVTEDFNFQPLNNKIEPLAMFCLPRRHAFVSIKISPENMQKTIKKVEAAHNNINGDYPFEYHFLDEEYGNLYESEAKQGILFSCFSFLAIFISCLGLFGLSSFMITQRTKEIGIRKANGAKNAGIMSLFTRYYTRWVIVSFLISVPVSYFFMHKWLQNFAYKTSLSWWVFVLAGLIAFVIAIVTVSWQSWRAANRNPVEALRYE